MAESKKSSESRTEMSQLMLPQHANMAGVVFGGTILALADSVAYVCASRHAGPNCVTVSVDRVDFREPIRIGELVKCVASVNFVGKTSMEIGIKIFAEDLKTGKKRHTNTCYFTMVALNDQGKPQSAPKLILETEDDKRRMHDAGLRRLARESLKRPAL